MGYDQTFEEITKLLEGWVENLSRKSVDDEKPPRPRDPLHDMKKILEYVEPQPNQWAQCMLVKPIDVASSGIYALGNIISHRYHPPKFIVSAEQVLRSLHVDGSIKAEETTTKQHTLKDDDIDLWTGFTKSLRKAGIQVRTGPGTATGQPSSQDPEFTDIITEEWQPNEDYLKSAMQVVMQRYTVSREPHFQDDMPFVIVVGTKTVRGHNLQRADRASPPEVGGEQSPASKIPEDLVIAYIFKDIREGPASKPRRLAV
jgi:hypothetical protein